ncbi:hypothetical protein HHK36_009433 [Tetracentron sinense]|uniref:HMA domain-containing protein n=1 Tax=Tetracentron sinense TaxID=13715 RepID=A0A834ZDD2_TETSI|nr:hypothetical protein HHK36_009433 [Tetracentron sinense]
MDLNRTKKMRGFMCQSPAATAVCMIGDPRSVIAPRRPDRTLVDHARFINNPKYSRLVQSRRFAMGDHSRSVSMSSISRERERKPSKIFTTPTSLTSSDHVFQVVVMRVSLHCQGCAGKVKKHLSKMEGNSGDVIQYRSGDEEGNCDGARVTCGSSREHIKSEKSGVLALLKEMEMGATLIWVILKLCHECRGKRMSGCRPCFGTCCAILGPGIVGMRDIWNAVRWIWNEWQINVKINGRCDLHGGDDVDESRDGANDKWRMVATVGNSA